MATTRARTAALVFAVSAALAIAAALALAPTGCGRAPRHPNVVLIDLDTFRGDHVGLYNQLRKTTPQLDGLARTGLYFRNAFSQAPRTLQSQMAIMTSRYAGSHNVGSDLWELPDTLSTLALAFRDAGYATAAYVDGGWVHKRYGYDLGFDTFVNAGPNMKETVPRAIEWLRTRPADKPFFLWVHGYDSHSPYDPYRFGEVREATGMNFGRAPRYDGRLTPMQVMDVLRMKERWPTLPDSERVLMERSYEYATSCADSWVGAIVETLDSLGLTDETVIACISDHGEAFLEHGLFFHLSLHHEILRVPFIIVIPDARDRSVIDDRIVETIDMAPTLLDIAGVAVPAEFEGRSLTRDRRLRPPGEAPADAWTPKAAHAESSPWDGDDIWWSITTDTHHLIRSVKTGERELYAWRDDPREATNLADREPALAGWLEEQLLSWANRTSASATPGHKPPRATPPSPKEEAEMRALGYVQ